MYRITVKTAGKYGNTVLGARYCLTRKSAKDLARLFLTEESEITIEKFIRIHGDIFCWTYEYDEVGFDEDEILDELNNDTSD